ncbi:MAG: hypothetical protein A3B38_03860 [Candidatus Levybacteria bacterium RIFCSPLOWO2_01_FULL_36_13]|nr:MAG: hypothetical protein A2684_00795 [Candidatus Levybacteria bacterium RIFCSPHIGHO2_01_FULL_36_15b]OGH34266.1 MAG: hypothetical protein A3B38_03860 [Candidatus Levybacteria bacterium RIFCSPLOWO2_01_FULL_36_13]
MKNKIDCYGASVSMRISEAQIQWERFNAMLVINTIFIGLIGFSFGKDFIVPTPIKEFLPLFGIFLCVLWFKVTRRGFMWTQFWTETARKIEEKDVDKNQIRPFNDGLIHKIENKTLLNTSISSYLIIAIFALIYFALLLITISTFLNNLCI